MGGLGAARDVVSSAAPPAARAAGPVPGPDAHHAVLDELRKAEYHRDDRSFVAQAYDWVRDHLDRMFAHLHGPAWTPGGWAFWVLVAVAVAVLGYALWRAELPRRRARAGADGADLLAPDTGVDHRQLAAALADGGRYAEALREWLRAAVASIEARGVLAPRPGRTGAAIAREAGPRLPSAAGPLAAAVAAFDEVWFGGRPATPADVELAHHAADLVDSARLVPAAEHLP